MGEDDRRDPNAPWLLERLSKKEDPYEVLIEAKFPRYKTALLPEPLTSRGSSGAILRQARLREQVNAYRDELHAKPLEEIRGLYDQEQKKRLEAAIAEQERLRQKADEYERKRFFNQPTATADFSYWAKMTYWSLDEAVALTLGKDPKIVNWNSVKGCVESSPFAKEYARRRDLVLRAEQWKQLYVQSLPGFFLGWAKRTGIAVVPDLIAAVEAQGAQVADWKTQFDKLLEQFNILKEDRDKLVAAYMALAQERNALKARLDELDSSAWEGFDESSSTYPPELDIAMQAWRAASIAPDNGSTVKKKISTWLEEHYPRLPSEAKQRIATVCNWEKAGGRPRRTE